jgi:1-acyl-sn-glycerol-3-phosphate acyltransferase
MSNHEIPMSYRILGKNIFRSFIEITSLGIDIKGKENLPDKPPYLIAFNHYGWVEGLVPYILLPLNNWPYTITKIENVKDGTIMGKILPALGFIGIRRGEADMTAIKKALDLLKKGNIIATSPEGTRARGSERLSLRNGKPGLIFLSQQFEPPLPIVPMAVWGQNERTFPLIDVERFHIKDCQQLRNEPLYVRIGKPFVPTLENAQNMSRSEIREILTDQLMDRISQLLPELK